MKILRCVATSWPSNSCPSRHVSKMRVSYSFIISWQKRYSVHSLHWNRNLRVKKLSFAPNKRRKLSASLNLVFSLLNHSALVLFAQSTRIPTSARSIGFCAIWVCISSSSSSSKPTFLFCISFPLFRYIHKSYPVLLICWRHISSQVIRQTHSPSFA